MDGLMADDEEQTGLISWILLCLRLLKLFSCSSQIIEAVGEELKIIQQLLFREFLMENVVRGQNSYFNNYVCSIRAV